MNSPFANIFLDLQKYITAQVPAIKYIDWDYGQLETPERPSIDFPCLLIDFKGWTFTDLGNLVQRGDGAIITKLATDPYDGTSNITPVTYVQAGLSIFDLEFLVYKKLHGYKPGIVLSADEEPVVLQSSTPMGRIGADSDNRRPGLKVRVNTFAHSFTDFSAKLSTRKVPATPNITTQFTT